jgi:2-iminobutanoate/2-iminopropanoate deaminase
VHELPALGQGAEGGLTIGWNADCGMMKHAVCTDRAPGAIGPYSQAVAVEGLLFVSGQIGLDPATGTLVGGGIEAEAERVLQNIEAVLAAEGLDMDAVARTTIYLVDLADFATVNQVYARHFVQPFPARATVGVAQLPKGARVEIDAIAMASKS